MHIDDVPEEAYQWMTDEIREALDKIRGPHARKKRSTVLKIGFARAQQKPVKPLFRDIDVCCEKIWHLKWKRDEKIQQALDIVIGRVLQWTDEETAAIEEHFRQQRRRTLAEYAAIAPAALAAVMGSDTQRGDYRIKAADTLIRFADPDVAGQLRSAGGLDVNVDVGDIDALIEKEFERLGIAIKHAEEEQAEGPSPGLEQGSASDGTETA